jgi:hypothetical protein
MIVGPASGIFYEPFSQMPASDRPATVVDVGANEGYYDSLLLSTLTTARCIAWSLTRSPFGLYKHDSTLDARS